MQKLQSKYDKVIIIGNGFDRNQGLPTGYNDFLGSSCFSQLIYEGNLLAKHLMQRKKLQRWIDVEKELEIYSRNSSSKEAENLKKDFNTLSESLKKYLSKIDYQVIKEEEESFKLLKEIKDADFLVLDFNYTDTVRTLFEYRFEKRDIEKKIIKVHGNCRGNIIFGVQDSARINDEHIFLRKAYSRHYAAYNFSEIFEKSNEIYVFGHSLGETDEMYFKGFFSFCADSIIKSKFFRFYYYGEDSYEDLMRRLDDMTYHNLSMFKVNHKVEFVNTKS